MNPIQIAIDGPVASGKSTIARLVAKRTGFLYVDTGAMYRAVALVGAESLDEIDIRLVTSDEGQRVFAGDEDVTEKIRSKEITMASSAVARDPKVRAFVTNRAKEIARNANVVMDGRDIGTVVLPDAKLKIYLDASPEIRARRRFDELAAKGQNPDFEALKKDIEKRDYDDSHREADPLRKADDAVYLDAGGMTVDEVVETIVKMI